MTEKILYGPFEVHAVCECGAWARPFQGELSFAPVVCPDCGQSKWRRVVRRARYWRPWRWLPFKTFEAWDRLTTGDEGGSRG